MICVDDDVCVLHVLVVECLEEWVGKAVALVAGCRGFLGFVLVAASRRDGGGNSACWLVRQLASCVQYCLWRAS